MLFSLLTYPPFAFFWEVNLFIPPPITPFRQLYSFAFLIYSITLSIIYSIKVGLVLLINVNA